MAGVSAADQALESIVGKKEKFSRWRSHRDEMELRQKRRLVHWTEFSAQPHNDEADDLSSNAVKVQWKRRRGDPPSNMINWHIRSDPRRCCLPSYSLEVWGDREDA